MGYEMELKYALEQIRTLERQINSGASTEDNTTNAPKATPEKPETSKGPDTTPEKTKDTLKPEREKPKVSRSNSRQSTKAKKKQNIYINPLWSKTATLTFVLLPARNFNLMIFVV